MRTPPRLPYRPRRIWRPVVVWAVLLTVIGLRIAIFKSEPAQRGRQQWAQIGGGGWGRRGRSAPPQPPVSAVPTNLWRISIEVTPRDADKLRGYFWGGRGGRQSDRPEVPCTVSEGGNVYTNVTIHLKGAAGSFDQFDGRPALTLNFAKNVQGRRFHDFGKISLNNSVQDDTYIAEALSRELFNAAGVPVPMASHATVILNGRDLGLYVLTEGWGKPFLKRHFKDVDGNLYDSGFVQDVSEPLDINSGEDGEKRTELRRLSRAAREQDATRRWQELSAVLDVDRFASFVAMEVLLCHWDGYALNHNNYRVFHDRTTDRMVFMPHGLDQLFGTGGRMWPNSSINQGMRGDVARAFVSTPEGHRLYMEKMAQLRSTVFTEERLTNRVHELASRIRSTIAAYDPGRALQHDREIEDFCGRISTRVQSVTEQMSAPKDPLTFGDDGSALITGWRSRFNQQAGGSPRFGRTEVDGRKALQIRAMRGNGSGSWRAHVRLGPGQYRLEGLVRTQGLPTEGGVALRISGAQRRYEHVDDGTWQKLSFGFVVNEPLADVEVICDFESSAGEAMFDEGSLRLVREPQ